MTTARAPRPQPDPPAERRPETVADLLDRLGGIPVDRVWLRPAPGTATEADVVAAHDRDGRLCELVEGTLVEKPMGARESQIAGLIIHLMLSFVHPRRLGVVLAPDGALRFLPGLVRIPDVSFLSSDRLPGGLLPDEPIPELAPDLVVEVLSASNTKREMARKRGEYFAAGVRLVWIIDPKTRTARAYTAPDRFTAVGVGGALDGGDVLPGFVLPLADLFPADGR